MSEMSNKLVEQQEAEHGREMLKDKLRKKINETEALLDGLNVRYCTAERLCLFCKAKDYDGRRGIIHDSGCIILLLRKLPSPTELLIKDAKEQVRLEINKLLDKTGYQIGVLFDSKTEEYVLADQHGDILDNESMQTPEETVKQERKDIGLELQLALSKVINFEGFNEFKLSKFIIDSASKLCKGQALGKKE